MEKIMMSLLAVCLSGIAIIVTGFVASKLYDWHIRSIFSSMPVIGMWRMVGIYCIVQALTLDITDTTSKGAWYIIDVSVTSIIVLGFLLLIGRVVREKKTKELTHDARG